MSAENSHLPPGVEVITTLPDVSPRIPDGAEARTIRVTLPPGDVIHIEGSNDLPDAQSQLVVVMFAPPGTPVLTLVGEAELAERRHLRVPRP